MLRSTWEDLFHVTYGMSLPGHCFTFVTKYFVNILVSKGRCEEELGILQFRVYPSDQTHALLFSSRKALLLCCLRPCTSTLIFFLFHLSLYFQSGQIILLYLKIHTLSWNCFISPLAQQAVQQKPEKKSELCVLSVLHTSDYYFRLMALVLSKDYSVWE